MPANNDTIQFRGKAEKEVTQIVDQMRLGGSTRVSLLDRVWERSFEKLFRMRRRSPFTSSTPRETFRKTLHRSFWMMPCKKSSASGRLLRRLRSVTGPGFSRSEDSGR